MNKPRLEDKDKVAKVYNSKGEVCETFSFRDHGNSYLSAAQNYLMQNYDKLMSESNDYFRRRKAEEDRIADKRDKHGVKLPPLRNPKQTDYEKMRKERKEQGLDEEVEQMDEAERKSKEAPVTKQVDVSHPDVHKALEDHLGGRFEHFDGIGHHHEVIGRDGKRKSAINVRAVHSYTHKDLGMRPEDMDDTSESYVVKIVNQGGGKYTVIHHMKEEVEQMDEGNKENKKKKNEYVSNIIKKKLSPKVLPSLKYGRQELKKEEVEQMNEISQDLALRAHAKANDVTSRRWNDKFASADLADKGSQGMFHHSSSGEEAADRTAKRLRERIGRKFGPEAAARAKRSEFGVVAPADTTPKKKSFLNRLGLTKEGVEQMDEAKDEYGPDSSLHGHPLRDIDAHLKDNGYIHSKKSDTTHHYTRKDGRMVVHVDSKTKKVVKAFLEPIKKLKEEVEQMDEVAPPGREKQVKALKGKVDNPYAVAWASYNKSKAETKSENTMYNNMLTKLEEGRGRPPKPGSEAWKRRQSAAAAGGAHVETPHIATQLMKHADYGFKNHTYKFSDGSTHEITPTQRDTVLRKLRSMTGPGKKPEDREKMYDEINTPAGFFHHTGDKPIASKKLHPMSAQKE